MKNTKNSELHKVQEEGDEKYFSVEWYRRFQMYAMIVLLVVALALVLITENSTAIVEWIMKYLKD